MHSNMQLFNALQHQGCHNPGKSWKVLELEKGPGKSWKVLEFQLFLPKVLEFYTAPSMSFYQCKLLSVWYFSCFFLLTYFTGTICVYST